MGDEVSDFVSRSFDDLKARLLNGIVEKFGIEEDSEDLANAAAEMLANSLTDAPLIVGEIRKHKRSGRLVRLVQFFRTPRRDGSSDFHWKTEDVFTGVTWHFPPDELSDETYNAMEVLGHA